MYDAGGKERNWVHWFEIALERRELFVGKAGADHVWNQQHSTITARQIHRIDHALGDRAAIPCSPWSNCISRKRSSWWK